MKKLYSIMLLMFSLLFVCSCSSKNAVINDRTINIKEDFSYVDYYLNKYNTGEKNLHMNEKVFLTDKIVLTSKESFSEIEFDSLLSDETYSFVFSYILVDNEKIIKQVSNTITLFEENDIFYLESTNGCKIKYEDIFEDSVIDECSARASFYGDVLGLNYIFDDGLGGCGGYANIGALGAGLAVGGAIGAVGAVLIYNTASKSIRNLSSSLTSMPSISLPSDLPNLTSVEINDSLNYLSTDTLTAIAQYNKTHEIQLTAAKIEELLDVMVRNRRNNDKVAYLGSVYDNGEPLYYDINPNSSVSFHVDNETWDNLITQYGREGMWLINRAYIDFLVSDDFTIYLVRNPDEYYIHGTGIIRGGFYANELKYLAEVYNSIWVNNIPFWEVVYMKVVIQ